MYRSILFVLLILLVVCGTPASASFPGHNGKIAFVGMGQGLSVMNADGSGETILTTGPANHPEWSADGSKIAFNDGNFAIYTISADGSNLTQLSGGYHYGPTFSPDGTKIAFFRGGQIWSMNSDGTDSIQLTQISLTATAPDGSTINCNQWAEEPAWSPDGTRIAFDVTCAWPGGDFGNIYVMNSDGSNLARITHSTPLTNKYIWDYSPNWSPDGTKLIFIHSVHETDYSSNQYSIVSIEPDGSNRINLAGPTSEIYTNASWSPDGTKIIFDGGASWFPPNPVGVLYEMNPDGTDIHPITDASNFRSVPTWQPIPIRTPFTPGKIVFQKRGGGITTIDPDGSNETTLTTDQDHQPRWSPDGSKIVFSRGTSIGPSDIYIMNNDGTNAIQLTTGLDSRDPNFSPDGSQIVFARGSGSIWKMNADGSNQTMLVNLPCWAEVPSWSTDGSQIGFDHGCSDSTGAYSNVYVMNSDGSDLTQLTFNSLVSGMYIWDWGIEWSPDGNKILMNRGVHTTDYVSNEYSLIVANPDGTNRVTVVGPTPQIYELATWSPDGTKILCDGGASWYPPNANGLLFVMDADGTNITALTDFSAFRFWPDWQPVPLPPPSSTPQGTFVPVAPIDSNSGGSPATVIFESVSEAGETNIASSSSGPPQPAGFKIGEPAIFYDLSTTATYTGLVSLCFSWTEGQFDNENNIQLFHYETGAWRDVTTSRDTTKNEVCGQTSSLSPFALFESLYTFKGFYSPVDNPPVRNVAKAGSAIPVRFSLGGNHGLSIFESSYPGSQSIECVSTAPLSAVEETVSAGGSSLSYDSAADQYTYVWKTSKAWAGSCRRLYLKFNNGMVKTAEFSFEK